ncbi:amino acid adenylation [Aspergillus homomorphus CBS 101889]|uniref:Amino acid adenylation n=1 Tax=Aspergillus homomorphus (strain CBS 101889) TaxID=1450537 RepID=A0A395I4Q2_ASPHC|nr:amino acid adenylation [Aspergillus homomorphus CBS 101889]RAL15192.1 amino acid adenylation [Aspergillus homomorphus CBS 101889]
MSKSTNPQSLNPLPSLARDDDGLDQHKEHDPGPCYFPSLGDDHAPGSGEWLQTRAPVPVIQQPELRQLCQTVDATVPAVLLGAWALVLRAYTATDAVSFGFVEEPVTQPSICILNMPEDLAPGELVQQAQGEWVRLRQVRSCALTGCGHSARSAGTTPFNTCLAFVSSLSDGVKRERRMVEGWIYDVPNKHGLLLEIDAQRAEAALSCKTSMLTQDQAAGVLETFCVAVARLMQDRNSSLRGQSLLGDCDRERIYAWNAVAPEQTSQCIHELIQARCVRQPERPAVCAWDGDFTYRQLSRLSADLAAHLVSAGVGPEVFVPICLEKSRWVAVAMLAVMQAGGAMVLLDVSHPPARLQQICREVSAQVVLTSPESAAVARALAPQVVVLGDVQQPAEQPDSKKPGLSESVTPDSALYAVFTSGSTGTPKGVIIEHATFYASVRPYTQALLLNEDSRVFQFASYAFDVTIFDTLITLIAGGCVCIPSDTDRWSDMARTIERFQVNHVSITPTVARLLYPHEVPTLKTLALGGESLSAADLARWTDHVHVINLYGASECPIISLRRRPRGDPGAGEVAYSTGSASWIVDPQDHETLMPIGAVGELLVEGPIVGRGYLNNPDATTQSFIPMPSWMRQFRGYKEHQGRRIYKVGDLVAYKADGSLRFVGRKDTQVKLRGQRIELNEVQHHLRQCFPEAADVVAEVVTPAREQRPPMLVAFIAQAQSDSTTQPPAALLAEPTGEFLGQSERARSHMQLALPPYMVPAVFLPLRALPLTGTSKTDRRRLRELAGALTQREQERFQLGLARRRPPATDMEKAVQRYFSAVLHIPGEEIGADDHFFRRGGSSLSAMELVAAARRDKHRITVKEIFDHPRLWEIASILQSGSDWTDSVPQPFSLLGPIDVQHVIRVSAAQCSVDPDAIEDIYPCTPLQEGLMALSMQGLGPSFVTEVALAVPAGLNLERLELAWGRLAQASPILRTRIVVSDTIHGMLQVVVRERISWTKQVEAAPAPGLTAVLGGPLVHLAICRAEESPDVSHQLVIHMHHAVYDGWTLPLLLQGFKDAYNELSLPARPFTPFIQYITSTQGQDAYWKTMTNGFREAAFPPLPSATYHPVPKAAISTSATIPPPGDRAFTSSTYISLAWSLTQAQLQGSHDIAFGAVRSGRNAPVPGIENLTAPTIATVPSRVVLTREDRIAHALQKLQKDTIDGIPFEQTGLQNIRRLGPDAARACAFQTLLVVQPERPPSADDSFLRELTSSNDDHLAWVTYCLTVICQYDGDALRVEAVFDDQVVPEHQMQAILAQFVRILRRLHEDPAVSIGEMLQFAPEMVSCFGQEEERSAFWNEEFGDGDEMPTFPRLPSTSYVPVLDQQLQHSFADNLEAPGPYATEAARYLASCDTVFGAALNGPVLPFRVRTLQGEAVGEYLDVIRSRLQKIFARQSEDCQVIACAGPGPAAACGFQSLLAMRRGLSTDVPLCGDGRTRALVIEIASNTTSTTVHARFDSNVISVESVKRMLQQFEHVALQLSANRTIAVKDVELASPRDKDDIYRWNSRIDERSETTVHALIEARTVQQPDAQAVCSWDGEMTYAQLDQVSSKLAAYLINLGVGCETYIPLCFEKSLWTIVAMVAVLKAGAAFVPLDASAPENRLRTMIQTVQATTLLCSRAQYDRYPSLAPTTIVLDASWERWLADQPPRLSSTVSPGNAAYVIFTSGSTGTPKGIVIEHGAFCTAALAHRAGLALGRNRVLQFSSYAFDVSLGEILCTLVHGGAVCVPSDQERADDIAAAINRMEVDYAFLTPSFASTVDPSSVPTLRTLCLAGEPMTTTTLETWASHVRLINGYGPAECCVISASNRYVTVVSHPANIGTAVGGACWVVDPENDQILAPVGAVGELLIEGANLARCYINQPELTQRAFIPRPRWMPFSRCNRLYKTGDLVRYQEDGSLVFVARKDTQVKIRGQRVELGEIEHQIMLVAGGGAGVSAVVVACPTTGGPFARRLVAVLESSSLAAQGETSQGTVLAPVPMRQLATVGVDVAAITHKIRNVLPSYMVPDHFITVERLPRSLSAKLDRKRVQSWLMQPPSEVLPRWGGEAKSEVGNALGTDETVAHAISYKIVGLSERDSGVSPVQRGHDFPIAAAGLDSIQLTSLVGFLRQTYAVNLTVRTLLDGTATVRSLAALVAGDTTSDTQKPQSIDLTGEVARLVQTVDRDLALAQPLPVPRAQGRVVFLTGCTSLLGTEILHQLCESDEVRRVIVHVRARTDEEASTRCREAARRARWWSEERHGPKLEAWAGDLGQPRLGLRNEQWACVSGSSPPSPQSPDSTAVNPPLLVDAIIHAGAAVNWNAGYELLRAVNVDATVDLIRAALTSPARPQLVYVSGGHTWHPHETETALADAVIRSGSGYGQSKFVAEMVVRRFAGPRLSVVKPGLIIGTPEEGVPNVDDYLWRLTAAAVGGESYSAEAALDTGMLWITSSARVAEAIVRNALAPVPLDRAITYITDGVAVAEYWDTVNEALGNNTRRLTPVPHEEWVSRVTRAIDVDGRTHPLWPVREVFEEVNGRLGGARFSDLGVDHHKSHVRAAIRKNVEFLVRTGVLGAADQSHGPSTDEAFRRAGQVWSSHRTV